MQIFLQLLSNRYFLQWQPGMSIADGLFYVWIVQWRVKYPSIVAFLIIPAIREKYNRRQFFSRPHFRISRFVVAIFFSKI